MTAKLSNATLDALPDEVARPTYDRTALTPGIVHIGVGNFHRAHQAWYLHRLFQMGLDHDWAIVGAGVRAADASMRAALRGQDHLTTLIELDPSGKSAEVVGSMIDFVPVEEGNGALIAAMADPAIRIVAMTVTEGGYYTEPVSKSFDPTLDDIQHDAAHPERPRTAFGAIVAALKRRRAAGHGPFTVQSCDNLQGNGNIVRQVVVGLARLTDGDLADWIDRHCTFPNSMVDCIVPATGPKERELPKAFGIDDAAPVSHENFRQWVIEDAFCAGRPQWEKAGATFTDRVHDFEAMKLRILNGGHQVVANLGELLNLATIAEAIAHPRVRDFFRYVQTNEIMPHVRPVPGTTPAAYVDLILQRFSNTAIADTTRRVAFDGASRHPGFILPSIRDGLAAGTPVEGLAFVEAAWARYCQGNRDDGSAVEPNDPLWPELTARAAEAVASPRVWLEARSIYGDLADVPRFADAFETWLGRINAAGTEAALNTFLQATRQ